MRVGIAPLRAVHYRGERARAYLERFLREGMDVGGGHEAVWPHAQFGPRVLAARLL